MKERVTLTIERELLERIDNGVNNTDVKNRSHAIELLLTKALGENKPSRAVILAGGRPSNNNDLNGSLPKSMLRIQDIPLIEHNLKLLKRHGIKEAMISIGEKGGLIKEYFGNGDQMGMNITYLEESAPLGTAGPLSQLKGKVNDTFILLNSDELKDIDLEDMFLFHKKNKGLATIALTTTDHLSDYGVAVMNGQRIMTFVEKPSEEHAPSKLINAGLYILEPEVLKLVPDGFAMLEQDVFPRLASQERLVGYVFSGQWFDTNTKEKLDAAERFWLGIK
jgi:NDP-sugar pyrophosphorylase family protein